MHANSMNLMRGFADKCKRDIGAQASVMDVGSGDVNGNYRELWNGWSYIGVDIAPGPNVDWTVPEDGLWSVGRSFNVVISGQCLEHTRRPWDLAETMGEHLHAGGLMCLIAPFAWPEHKHPIDCWRFAPDGMRELLSIAGCEVVSAELVNAGADATDRAQQPEWCADCIGVGRKR